jgi:hypothetical protein
VAQLWRRIESDFPRSDDVRHAAGVPVNLGLENLAFSELLHHPYSQYGGRVGGWQRRALEVLGPEHAKAINVIGHLKRAHGIALL